MRCFARALLGVPVCVLALLEQPAAASVVHVTPSDSFEKIESARGGDEVVLASGTYRFRVYLELAASADRPLIIRGEDPQNPPVWDLSGGNVEDAPGSYTAGDRGRGCWQLSGATNIRIEDLVITGCHTASHNSAGLRYYNGTKGIQLRRVLFRDNDNGLTGGTQDSEITVEFSEFDRNGNLQASSSAPTHNIYVYGGHFVLRYSYVHDPIQGQNFHVRARDSLLEYNWFARAKSYQGDLMTSDDAAVTAQTMILRGNLILQGDTQSNTSQVIAVYNDGGVSGLTLRTELLFNTFVGNGGHAALVHLSNADQTQMSARLDNNLVWGTNTATRIEDRSRGTVSGTNNWLATGADATDLLASVFGNDPGFINRAGNDFTLRSDGSAVGQAAARSEGAPDREYYRDEIAKCEYRIRASAKDIGAFESTTTGSGLGPDGTESSGGSVSTGGQRASGGSVSTGGQRASGGSVSTGGQRASGGAGNSNSGGLGGSAEQAGSAGAYGGGATTGNSASGCGCGVNNRDAHGTLFSAMCALILGLIRRRRSRRYQRSTRG